MTMKRLLPAVILTVFSFMIYPGELRLLGFADYYGNIEESRGYETLRGRLYFQPRFQAGLFDGRADLTVSANLWYQPIGEDSLVAVENILREAYLWIPAGNFDFSIGQKFAAFGFADAYSPLNVINSSDQTIFSLDDTTDGRRPDGMVQIEYYPNFSDTLELIYVPFPRGDYDPYAEESIQGETYNLDLNRAEKAYLTEKPHSLFARYYHFSDNFDLQLVYAWFTEQTPGYDFSATSTDSGTVAGVLEEVYYRNNLFGAGISTAAGDTILSEDLAFTLTSDREGKDPGIANSSITANTQITGTVLNGTFAQVNIVYQYFLNFGQEEDFYGNPLYRDLISQYNSLVIQPQEQIAFLVAHLHRYFLREKLYLGLNAGLFYPRIYLAPRIEYALSDRMRLEAGADINTGEADNNVFTGKDEADNFYLRVKYEY